jgi:hypothetical protein
MDVMEVRLDVVTSAGVLLCSRRSPPEGWRGRFSDSRRRRITGQKGANRGRGDASGLTAGITIVAAILVGTGIGYGLGSLLDAAIPVALAGAAAGVVLGFYAVYVRFIRQ